MTEFDRALFEVMRRPEYRDWEQQVHSIGGCENPIQLVGRTITADAETGAVLHVFDSATQPYGRLMVPCGNRRASRCEPCSRLYQRDTFHLIRAGLVGGKGVPSAVAVHPRVFATLTAPSFGSVHSRVDKDGEVQRCQPRRRPERCDHGEVVSCSEVHGEGDPRLGTPLCAACFDYCGAVLWNAHAGLLWHRFTDDLRRVSLPGLSGLTKREFADAVRVSFAKVAEYQRRGLVHFHAVVRLDGPEGADREPPAWASVQMLDRAIRASAQRVRVWSPEGVLGSWELGWGVQLDVRSIRAFGEDEALTDDAVAAYVAKYATKAAECVGTLDRPITCRRCGGTGLVGACPGCMGTGLRVALAELSIPEHARNLVTTAWRLGGLLEYRRHRLRAWAHQCGFGGHFSTKSRHYSVTMGALREARAEYRAEQSHEYDGLPGGAVVTSDWAFAGSGYRGVEADIAAGVRDDIALNREVGREEVARIRAEESDWAGWGWAGPDDL
jgi:hypothetical protein